MTPVATPPAPASQIADPTISAPTPEQAAAAREAEARLAALLEQGDVSQANAATAIYGDSGTGKSSLAATGVIYCWRRFHKISRYVAADLGGFGNKLLRLIRLGIVQAYNPQNHVEPFETMEDLSLGYWPEKILDPFTGYAAPDVKLIPPQTTTYRVYCPHGHLVRTLASKLSLHGFSIQCATCKVVTTTQNWSKVEEIVTRAPGFEHVGLTVFDSGTALQDWAMSDMANRAAKAGATSIGDSNSLTKVGGSVISGKYAFGVNTMPHYGFAQNRMPGWIRNSRTIPGQVVPPIWTFLELRATDDSKNIAIYGPKIAGNAKTSDVPSWVGNCLNTTTTLNEKGRNVHRLWLVNHIDPGSMIPHLAKTRAEPGTMPEFLEDPEGEPFTRFSLEYFFDQLDQALAIGTQQDVMDFPDAPAFKPLAPAETNVITSRDLGGEDIAPRVGGGMPAAAIARPAVAAAVARPVAGVAGAAGAAVAGQAAKPATVAQPSPTPAAAAQAPTVAKVPPTVPAATPAPATPARSAPPATATPAAAQVAQPAQVRPAVTKPAAVAAPAVAAPAAPAPQATVAKPVVKPVVQQIARPAAVATAATVAPAPAAAPAQAAPQVAQPAAATAATTAAATPQAATVRPPATSAVARPAQPGRPPVPPPAGTKR